MRTTPIHTSVAVALGLALLGGSGPVAGQESVEDSYQDPTARRLHEAAMAQRERVDDSVLKYTAVVRQRIAAALRMPLKDRTLYRSESSHRLWWERDDDNLVQLLAYREQTPGGINREDIDLGRFDGNNRPAERLLTDLLGQRVTPFGAQLLRVVDPFDADLGREDHRPGDDRAGERPDPDLVDAGDALQTATP